MVIEELQKKMQLEGESQQTIKYVFLLKSMRDFVYGDKKSCQAANAAVCAPGQTKQ